MAKRRDERPANIVAPNYEETTNAQNPGVAEENVERKNGLTATAKKQRESGGKRMIQRLNEENCRHENTVLSTWK